MNLKSDRVISFNFRVNKTLKIPYKINTVIRLSKYWSKKNVKANKIAENKKVNLEFEASVGGGIPILRSIKEGLATNKIHKIYGILNGTCNYILTEMEKTGGSFNWWIATSYSVLLSIYLKFLFSSW